MVGLNVIHYKPYHMIHFNVMVGLNVIHYTLMNLLYISGAPALTSRNMKNEDFVKVIDFIDRAVEIGIQAQQGTSKIFWLISGYFHLHYDL